MNPVNAVCEFVYDALVCVADAVVDLAHVGLFFAFALLLPLGAGMLLQPWLHATIPEPAQGVMGLFAVTVWATVWVDRVKGYLNGRRDRLRFPPWSEVRKRI